MRYNPGDPVWLHYPSGEKRAAVIVRPSEVEPETAYVTDLGIEASVCYLSPRTPLRREKLGEWELCPWQPEYALRR